MGENPTPGQLLEMFKRTTLDVVRLRKELTTRQLAILMTCYLQEEPQTVRSLAEGLGIAKPAVTRALDRLTMLELARRKPDPADRRSVLVARTAKGVTYMRLLQNVLTRASAASFKQKAA